MPALARHDGPIQTTPRSERRSKAWESDSRERPWRDKLEARGPGESSQRRDHCVTGGMAGTKRGCKNPGHPSPILSLVGYRPTPVVCVLEMLGNRLAMTMCGPAGEGHVRRTDAYRDYRPVAIMVP